MKLHIFGASGSGVTTLGKAISKELNIKYFDSDEYFWTKTEPPFTIRQNPIQRNQLVLKDLNTTENWILGGSIIHWGDNLFPTFDLIVFLYLPKETRLERLKKREFERFGDIIYNNLDRTKQFEDFINWAADYDVNTGIANRTLQAHETWLAETKRPFLKIIGDLTTSEMVKLTIDKLQEEKLLPTAKV